jgi:Lysophospholipase L1 and related esterases
MKSVMFFGDSNTWGYNPIDATRYPDEVRYTGILRAKMPQCRIIEEGLNSRTNSTEDDLVPYRNGAKMLPMILGTHDPLDILVVMLGTNDVKRKFGLSAMEIASGLEQIIRIAQAPPIWRGTKVPEILIVCPPAVTMDYEGSDMEHAFDETSVEKSAQLPLAFEEVAKAYHCEYLNAMEVAKVGKVDGVHLEEEGHRLLAEALSQKLNDMILV